MNTTNLLRPNFTTRQEYENAIVWIADGIMHARGADRKRREAFMDAFAKEMTERFPIPTYSIVHHNGAPASWRGMDKHVAEARLKRLGADAHIEQDGVR